MKKTEWNSGWTFTNLLWESESYKVDLPHDAALTESRIPRLKNGSFTGYYPGGKYSYTKKLMVTDTPENRTVIIEFEGAYMKPVVYLNGEQVGERIYGYSNFYVDLTGKLRCGEENEITVITDSTQNQNTRWYSGSGLYRGVNLERHVGRENIMFILSPLPIFDYLELLSYIFIFTELTLERVEYVFGFLDNSMQGNFIRYIGQK